MSETVWLFTRIWQEIATFPSLGQPGQPNRDSKTPNRNHSALSSRLAQDLQFSTPGPTCPLWGQLNRGSRTYCRKSWSPSLQLRMTSPLFRALANQANRKGTQGPHVVTIRCFITNWYKTSISPRLGQPEPCWGSRRGAQGPHVGNPGVFITAWYEVATFPSFSQTGRPTGGTRIL